MKRFISALTIILAALLCLCGCGEQEQIVSNFERPIIDLCSSFEHSDSAAYLSCFTPAAKKAYQSTSSSSESGSIIETVAKNSGLDDNRKLSCEVIGKRELAGADREKLKKQYRSSYAKNVTIEKAFQIDAAIVSAKGTDMRKFTVVLIDSSWYIFGDVIEKFNF